MPAPARVGGYLLLALVLAWSAATVATVLDPCTDLDSDCDVQVVGGFVWAVLAVVLVLPVVVAVTESVAWYRGWDRVRPAALRGPRPPAR